MHARLLSHRSWPSCAWLQNLNAGVLPDGRRYLLSNAMPNIFRDPLVRGPT